MDRVSRSRVGFVIVLIIDCFSLSVLEFVGGSQSTFVRTTEIKLRSLPLLSTLTFGNNTFPNVTQLSISDCPLLSVLTIGNGVMNCPDAKGMTLKRLGNLQTVFIADHSVTSLSTITVTEVPKLMANGLHIPVQVFFSTLKNATISHTSPLRKLIFNHYQRDYFPISSPNELEGAVADHVYTSLHCTDQYDKVMKDLEWSSLPYLITLTIDSKTCLSVRNLCISNLRLLKVITIGNDAFSKASSGIFSLSNLPSLARVTIGSNCFTSFNTCTFSSRRCSCLKTRFGFVTRVEHRKQ